MTVEVKVYEYEGDEKLNQLADKVHALVFDGLVWYKENFKLVPVAFGIKKLQVSCIIEDDKVLTDDIVETIQAWEDEVQSVDIVSMQKN